MAWNQLCKRAGYIWGLEPDWELKVFLKLIPKGKALDLGVGEGRSAFSLAQSGFEVLGIDISKVAVEKCNALAAKLNLPVQAQVGDLRFPIVEGAYTCVICSYALPWRSWRGSRPAWLKEASLSFRFSL